MGKSILVVEDERIVAKDLQHCLTDLGYDVPAPATSSDEALRSAAQRCPDLALMDVHIRGPQDGVETAELLRTRFGVPVVFLTAYADALTIERSKATQPYGYLLKPVQPRELRAAIEVAFHRAELERRGRCQLEHTDRLASIGTLTASVAHEVRNPLTYLVANLKHAREAVDRRRASAVSLASEQEWLDELAIALADANDGAERVGRILHDVQALAKPQAATREPVDVRACFESAAQLAASELRPVARVVRSYGDVPCALADATRLVQVFVNLLVNAAHAMADRPVDNNVVELATATDEQGRVVASVRDTGCGMTPETASRIFDPFFTTKPVGKGTGLGLSVSKGIVQSFGGEILVATEAGAGTTFRIVLPAATASSASTVVEPSAVESSTVTSATAPAALAALE